MRKSHPDLPTYHQRPCSNTRRVGPRNAASRPRSVFSNVSAIAVIGISVFVLAYLLCPLQVLVAQDAAPQEQTPQQPPTDGTQTPDTPDEPPADAEQPSDATDETEAEEDTASERLNPETDIPEEGMVIGTATVCR